MESQYLEDDVDAQLLSAISSIYETSAVTALDDEKAANTEYGDFAAVTTETDYGDPSALSGGKSTYFSESEGEALSQMFEFDAVVKKKAAEQKVKEEFFDNAERKYAESLSSLLDSEAFPESKFTFREIFCVFVDKVNKTQGTEIKSGEFIRSLRGMVNQLSSQKNCGLARSYTSSLLGLDLDNQQGTAEVADNYSKFLNAVKVYSRLIVSEKSKTYLGKTLKPVKIGGIAGGEKFIAQ
jgi:hypothetical protein